MHSKPHLMKQIGQWRWNSELVNSKVDKTDEFGCHPWLGSQSPAAPLFGARKNNYPQMTQAARILYRDWYNEDCEDKEITHKCGNKNCMNPDHWLILPIKKHGRRPNPPKQIAQAKLTKVKKKEWFK